MMTLLLLCSASLSHGCVMMFRLGFASPFRRGADRSPGEKLRLLMPGIQGPVDR